MSIFKINELKRRPVYYYSKIAPYGKVLTIKLNNGIKFLFRARTLDRTVLKDVWTKGVYEKKGFEINETDTVVDIGGHIGAFSVFAANQARKGKVLAFEPFKENYDLLVSNINLNGFKNVIVENKGIGKEDGSSRFYLRPKKLEKGEIAYNTGGHSFHLIKESDTYMDVPTLSFDSMVDEFKLDKIDFLKMDCEGAEFEIIYNASEESLAKVSKITMECHPFENYTMEGMVEFLERHGFECIVDKDSKYDLYLIYAIRSSKSESK